MARAALVVPRSAIELAIWLTDASENAIIGHAHPNYDRSTSQRGVVRHDAAFDSERPIMGHPERTSVSRGT
jgi:hypothetical protein